MKRFFSLFVASFLLFALLPCQGFAKDADAEMLARAREAVERSSFLKAARAALADGQVDEGLRLLDQALEVTSDADTRAAIAAQRATIARGTGRR